MIPDRVQPVAIDEAVRTRERPRQLARRLSREKSEALVPGAGELILTADTVVAVGRRILGKPNDAIQARDFLKLLSGRRHRVITGIVARSATRSSQRLVETVVAMKVISDTERDAYIRSGEWQDKAGAYAIQGFAAVFARRINGSYSNIVGLPLAETAALLGGHGYPVLARQTLSE